MRGSVVNRGKNRWALVLDRGYVVDSKTSERKRQQKWIAFHGTRKQAEKKLTDVVGKLDRGEFVEPTKRTTGEWLTEWLEKIVKPSKRPGTHRVYAAIIGVTLTPAIGMVPLQQLKAADLTKYIGEHADLAPATLHLHHAIISGALKSAVKNGLVTKNVAKDIEGLPKIERSADDVRANVLDATEARRLLVAATAAGPRIAAFYALALDSGARIGELAGLKWTDVDFDNRRVSIVRQLTSPALDANGAVQFGPTKTGRSRSVDLGAETISLLRKHKSQQAEIKMKNRAVYRDFGLVFAKEAADLFRAHDALGEPFRVHNLGAKNGEFTKLLKAAKVRRVTFHALRHTSATLLLASGEPVKIVSERLGHAKASMTLDIYAHTLPTQGRGAADRLGALLHG